jgi:hypothetical protein
MLYGQSLSEKRYYMKDALVWKPEAARAVPAKP